MMPYKHILAVVDMDATDNGVVRRAAQIARQFQAVLTVLHVVDHAGGFEVDQVPMVSTYQVKAAMARSAHQRIANLLARNDAADARIEVACGQPRREISRRAGEWEADLIIIGGPEARYGLDAKHRSAARTRGRPGWDVLTVQDARSNVQRLRGLLTPLLSAG